MKRKSIFVFLVAAAIALCALLPVTQVRAAEVIDSGNFGINATWSNESLTDANREHNYVDPDALTDPLQESDTPPWLLWLGIAGGVLLRKKVKK